MSLFCSRILICIISMSSHSFPSPFSPSFFCSPIPPPSSYYRNHGFVLFGSAQFWHRLVRSLLDVATMQVLFSLFRRGSWSLVLGVRVCLTDVDSSSSIVSLILMWIVPPQCSLIISQIPGIHQLPKLHEFIVISARYFSSFHEITRYPIRSERL